MNIIRLSFATISLCCWVVVLSLLYPASTGFRTSSFSKVSASGRGTGPAEPVTRKTQTTVMRGFRQVTLGQTRDETRSILGKADITQAEMDEYRLDSGEVLTIRYNDSDRVKVIQIYIANPKLSPPWTEVVGDAEVVENPNGSRFARKEVPEENFWVTMYQSKSGEVTTITISEQSLTRSSAQAGTGRVSNRHP